MYDPNRKANQWYANSSCSSNVSHVSHPFTCSHRDDRGKPKLSLRAVETGPLMLSQKWALKNVHESNVSHQPYLEWQN